MKFYFASIYISYQYEHMHGHIQNDSKLIIQISFGGGG